MNAQVGRNEPKRPKKTLNDRTLKTLKPAVKGEGTYDQMDALVPGFGVRVSEAGRKTFMLAGRYPGSTFYARRALGIYGAMRSEKAAPRPRRGWS